MTRWLERFGRLVADHPWRALVVLLVITVAAAAAASQVEQDTSVDAFTPDSELARQLEALQVDYERSDAFVQVIVDGGEQANLLTVEGLEVAEQVEAAIEEAAGDRLQSGPEGVVSYRTPVEVVREQVPDLEVDEALVSVLRSEDAAELSRLLAGDVSPEEPSTSAGLVLVTIDGDLSEDERRDAAVDVRDAVQRLDDELDEVALSSAGEPLISADGEERIAEELPLLFGSSLLLVVLVLAVLHRRVGDVIIGFVGLVVAVVWTYGAAALLGPSMLDVIGPMTQIGTVIPVVVVGLGVDYAVHLTFRQRDEVAAGRSPGEASTIAVATVGGALVLTTATTAIGFGTNVASPIPAIGDFGVATAIGVVAAFVVMVTLVPAGRTLLDRRRGHGGADSITAPSRALPGRLMGAVAGVTLRTPVVVLVVAGAVSAGAVAAGTQVPTTFSTEQFAAEGSPAGQALDDLERLFGANAAEQTFVVLEGDVLTPTVMQEVEAFAQAAGDLEAVRSASGQAVVTTPNTVVRRVAQQDPAVAQELTELGWDPDTGFTAETQVPEVVAVVREVAADQVGGFVSEDGEGVVLIVGTAAGESGAADLRDRLEQALRPVADAGAEVQVVSRELLTGEVLERLTGSQARSVGITIGAALMLLVGVFWLTRRRPALGVLTLLPTVLVVAWVAGAMWLVGLSFNVLTVTISAIAIAIGVDYGIHVAYRFEELRAEGCDAVDAATRTVTTTGGALLGSAATTVAGFAVLVLSTLEPITQFGLITGLVIVFSLVAATVVEPACLVLWARWHDRRDRRAASPP